MQSAANQYSIGQLKRQAIVKSVKEICPMRSRWEEEQWGPVIPCQTPDTRCFKQRPTGMVTQPSSIKSHPPLTQHYLCPSLSSLEVWQVLSTKHGLSERLVSLWLGPGFSLFLLPLWNSYGNSMFLGVQCYNSVIAEAVRGGRVLDLHSSRMATVPVILRLAWEKPERRRNLHVASLP